MTDPRALRARADHVLELHEQGLLEQALDAAGTLAQDAARADTSHPVVRESLFAARFERALLLTELGDLTAAARAYAQAAATPADLDDADQRHEVAMALLNRGICLDAVGEHDAAIDDLVTRFRGTGDPVQRRGPAARAQVAAARRERANILVSLGRAPRRSRHWMRCSPVSGGNTIRGWSRSWARCGTCAPG